MLKKIFYMSANEKATQNIWQHHFLGGGLWDNWHTEVVEKATLYELDENYR
jgi:hypothetical protein